MRVQVSKSLSGSTQSMSASTSAANIDDESLR